MSRQILAIDIRTRTLSAVLLTTGLKSLTIEDAMVVSYDQAPEQQDPLQHALSQLHAQLPVTDAVAIVGLPGNQSFYRTLTVPFADPKKIRQILAFELEPVLPLPVERMVFDFGVNRQDANAEILATVTDREYLNRVLDGFSQIGLNPQLIAPGGFAMAAALAMHPHLPEQCLVMDMDADQINLFALSRGHILMVRSMQFDMTADNAVKGLTSRIHQTLTGYNDTASTAFSPTALYLTGAGLVGQNIIGQWAASLDMAVESVNLYQLNPKIETAPTLAQWQPAVSDGALALALIQTEGLPCLAYHRTGSAFHSIWDTYRPYVRGPIMLMLLLILFFLVGTFWDIHALQRRVDLVEDEMSIAMTAAFPDVGLISTRPADQMRSKLIEYKKSIVDPTHAGNQVRIIDMLQQISTLIPKEADVLLNRLVVGSNSITIAGETIDFNTVEDVKSRLQTSAFFNQVEITSSDRDKSGQKVRFRLKIDL
jgi:type II secretion system protein L